MCDSGVQVISTSAIDEEDKEEDQVAAEETRAVRVFDQVIVTVNLLSKQYCAFKNNTNKFVLNYESIPSLFACQYLKKKNLQQQVQPESKEILDSQKNKSPTIDTRSKSQSQSPDKNGSTNYSKLGLVRV